MPTEGKVGTQKLDNQNGQLKWSIKMFSELIEHVTPHTLKVGGREANYLPSQASHLFGAHETAGHAG